jgi:hypothetical protein
MDVQSLMGRDEGVANDRAWRTVSLDVLAVDRSMADRVAIAIVVDERLESCEWSLNFSGLVVVVVVVGRE